MVGEPPIGYRSRRLAAEAIERVLVCQWETCVAQNLPAYLIIGLDLIRTPPAWAIGEEDCTGSLEVDKQTDILLTQARAVSDQSTT